MPRVVPSQVVEFIDRAIPRAKDQLDSKDQRFSLDRGDAEFLASVVTLVEQIPPELLLSSGDQYVALVSSVSAIKIAMSQWPIRNYAIERIRGLGNLNPVSHIRRALSQCPDEFPVTGGSRLNFILDSDFRKNLEIDLNTTNQALSNGEWKAATVLAGSVIEALLLWVLKTMPTASVDNTVKMLVGNKTLAKAPSKTIDEWVLHQLIEVAASLSIIKDETAVQARLAKDFRNLIHPGKEVRLKQRCDRGTALSTVAAVELILRDLTI